MKKNAILIASIVFVAGCATNKESNRVTAYPSGSYGQSGYISIPENREATVNPSHPSVASQYDPSASGSFGNATDNGHNELTSVDDYHADSSVRGGSNQARGVARNGLPVESVPPAMSPSLQADSSVRGGSMQARQSDKDDQIRSSQDSALRGSANWNASDDLLKDGTGPASAETVSPPISNIGTGAPANTEKGGSSSSSFDSDTQRPTTSDSAVDRFRNNPAQGLVTAPGSDTAPGSPDQLAQRVKATLTREATGTFGMVRSDIARSIQVSSHGSTIILTGSVPSQRDKDMIEVQAREISGVQRVDNQLKVVSAADPSVRDATVGHDLEDRTDNLNHLEQK